MNNTFQNKYLKYKKKYLDLRIKGGNDETILPEAPIMKEDTVVKAPISDLGKVKKVGSTPLKLQAPVLGIIRLDYDYPPAPGDIDHPDSYGYDVIYRVVPGLTFSMCQTGDLTDEVILNCIDAVKYLNDKNVVGITGDCGFMINIQDLINEHTDKPVFLTSLVKLPSLCACYDKGETIAVFTANSVTLDPILPKLLEMSAVKPEHQSRIQIVGCQNVDGFDAVEKGEKVDVERVTPGIVALALEEIAKNPKIKCILLECTELPPYSDALKYETGLPVYDSISVCNSFMGGFLDNPRFGLNNFQAPWDGKQDPYKFGDNLTEKEKDNLVNTIGKDKYV